MRTICPFFGYGCALRGSNWPVSVLPEKAKTQFFIVSTVAGKKHGTTNSTSLFYNILSYFQYITPLLAQFHARRNQNNLSTT